MKFEIYEIKLERRSFRSSGSWRADFWQEVEEEREGLSGACGCYIYTTKHGGTQTPWYVGKAEKQSFKKRVLKHRTLISDIFQTRRCLYLFLLPSLTENGEFRKPRETRSISHLEAMLIGMALQKNKSLRNVQLAHMLRTMYVPGVVNRGPGATSTTTQSLRNTLGLSA